MPPPTPSIYETTDSESQKQCCAHDQFSTHHGEEVCVAVSRVLGTVWRTNRLWSLFLEDPGLTKNTSYHVIVSSIRPSLAEQTSLATLYDLTISWDWPVEEHSDLQLLRQSGDTLNYEVSMWTCVKRHTGKNTHCSLSAQPKEEGENYLSVLSEKMY